MESQSNKIFDYHSCLLFFKLGIYMTCVSRTVFGTGSLGIKNKIADESTRHNMRTYISTVHDIIISVSGRMTRRKEYFHFLIIRTNVQTQVTAVLAHWPSKFCPPQPKPPKF